MSKLLGASSSELEPNSDTDSESSVAIASIESGGLVPTHDSGEGLSVPDQFTAPRCHSYGFRLKNSLRKTDQMLPN
jgi:hypothetical protein